ncbi:MAG: hypothetical protein ACXVA4_02550 [Ktedonobacterales bacterium]
MKKSLQLELRASHSFGERSTAPEEFGPLPHHLLSISTMNGRPSLIAFSKVAAVIATVLADFGWFILRVMKIAYSAAPVPPRDFDEIATHEHLHLMDRS